MAKRIIGWKLKREDRARLLRALPPSYDRVIADHVTLNADAGADPLPQRAAARLIGRTDDGQGVEAMVVEISGTVRRPGGGVFHITWSLGPGRAAAESNHAIAEIGWKPIAGGTVQLLPAELGRNR